MTAPIVPPTGRNPAGPGQREAARDHAGPAPARRRDLPLDRRRGRAVPGRRPPPGLRPQASPTRHRRRRPHRDQPGPAPGPAGRGRHPAAAARPARDGPRLGPHRPRYWRAPRDHPQARPRRRRAPSASSSATPSPACTTPGGINAPPPAPAPSAPPPPPLAHAPWTGDWCAPAALDDDLLDIPGYRPEYGWKPATGTGVAPDVRPPARHHRRRRGA